MSAELEKLLESVAREAILAQHDPHSDEFIGNVLKRRLLPLLESGDVVVNHFRGCLVEPILAPKLEAWDAAKQKALEP